MTYYGDRKCVHNSSRKPEGRGRFGEVIIDARILKMCILMGKKMNACRTLVGKPEGKRPLGRARCMWVDNIKMDLKETGLWYGLDRSGSG
jgi:hypothetical protein